MKQLLLSIFLFATLIAFGQIHEAPNGNVGIGTTNPDSKLHVAGNGAVIRLQNTNHEDTDNAFYGWLGGYDMSGDEVWWLGEGSSNTKQLGFFTNRAGYDLKIFNKDRGINIRDNGNVSIGTEAYPKSQLVVESNFGANISGSTGGNAVFGSNLAVVQGGTSHNNIVTPASHTNNYGFSGMRASWGKLYFYTKYGDTVEGVVVTEEPRMYIGHNGKIGMGTTSPDSKLTVKGKIHAEEVKVDLSVPGPDYVFKANYELKSLEEVQDHIKKHGHLPNIPSAREMEENGIQLGEMNMKLLEKIEELTLYILEQEEKLAEQETRLIKIEKLLNQNR
ncbi:tail fiber protein [Flagellimonas sp. HMM57]|uniref:tail fiber protein n=1 Tax=unclassified Flagellimonas TaxID=2644544 RepID=UPI0013D1EE94|nr:MULTISPECIES: tail fiber protein [unclassified Flagellimonas]UII77355.1 tail fiber protein [Flagellimonas sp. HMM57]